VKNASEQKRQMPMDEESRKMVQIQMLPNSEGSENRLRPLQAEIRRPLMVFKAQKVEPIYKPAVRALCCKRYAGHPYGCPNFGKRPDCPPDAPLLPEFFDTTHPFWALWVDFDLEQWVATMQAGHPGWSYGQCANLRYWQPKARKFLREHAEKWAANYSARWKDLTCEQGFELASNPEAMGIDVTSTMKRIGVHLEWPPKKIVRKIYLLGARKR